MEKMIHKVNLRNIVGVIVVLFAILCVCLLFFVVIPKTNNEILFMALGVVLAKFGSVVDYLFGSSKGSTDKTDLLINQTKNET